MTRERKIMILAIGLALASASPALHAVEGGLGRPITGMQIAPFAGIVPPDPGFIWQLGYIYYSGELGGAVQAPIGGELALGLDVDLSLFTATGVYIWDTPKGRWNYASMLTVPWIVVDVSATAVAGNRIVDLEDDASDFFDLYFAPIIASYHVSEVEHWSFGLYVYAPTASYEVGRLANPGLNVWTVSPTVGYTKLFSKGTLEFSALSAVEFYSENEDTDYQNGEVFRLDLLGIKRFPNGWGVGLVGGWIEQISDDDGGLLTERLDGFKGHSLGLGPMVSYSHKSQAGEVDVSLRWVPEFDVKKRFEGDGVLLSVGLNF